MGKNHNFFDSEIFWLRLLDLDQILKNLSQIVRQSICEDFKASLKANEFWPPHGRRLSKYLEENVVLLNQKGQGNKIISNNLHIRKNKVGKNLPTVYWRGDPNQQGRQFLSRSGGMKAAIDRYSRTFLGLCPMSL